MSLTRALVLKRSGVTLFTLWTFFACGGRDNAEIYGDDGGLITCGDGHLDVEEDCDGSEFRDDLKDCDAATKGARPQGTVKCARNCSIDTNLCRAGGGVGGGGMGGTMGGQSGRNGGGTFGMGGRSGGGTFGMGGRNNGGVGGTMGMGGRNNGGVGGTMGMGGRGRGRGAGGNVSTGGSQSVDAGLTPDSGTIVDAGPACTGTSDCGSGQVCCGTIANGQYTGFTCAASCGTNDTVVDCSKPSDCGNGQVCCGALQVGQNTHYTSIGCQANCDQAMNEYVQCASNTDCANGLTCQTSQFLPTQFRVCR